MPHDPRAPKDKPVEDSMANWGWGLGLIMPPFGFAMGIILTSRNDRRGPWIIGWSLIVPIVVVAYLLVS
jgi:hypothetical protein